MEKSKVYFTDMRCPVGVSLQDKLARLIETAGIEKIDFRNKYVVLKIHFGEPGNLSFLRPNFSKTVADKVIALGGKPFLSDCNTLYVGRRKDALEHLGAAQENGFSMQSTSCQIIIGDGLKGTDDLEVPVRGGEYCKTARIGRAIMDADIFISVTHFKGHELTNFGGALKNIGMGCGSRAGKMQMHNEGKPAILEKFCASCGVCSKFCAQDAISYREEDGKASIDHERCVGCGRCIGVCNFNAIENESGTSNDNLSYKIAEYAKAVVDGRPHFHVSIVNQVSPFCDCHADNDTAIVPDIGMFASFDPVALDAACIQAVNEAPAAVNSILSACDHEQGHNHFKNIHPTTDWRGQIRHGEKIGLGSGSFDLITI